MSIDPLYCSWDTNPTFIFFSDNVFGNFIYYTHLLPVASILIFIFLLLIHHSSDKSIRALTVSAVAFTAWSLSDLIIWSTANPDWTMFFWSVILHFEVILYYSILYFTYYFISGRPPSLLSQGILFVLYLPLILFGHTNLNLVAFDYTNCLREAVEGPLVIYAYIIEAIIAIWILFLGISNSFKNSGPRRKEIVLFTSGAFLFLAAFSSGNIAGTFQIDWEIGQYGLLSVPVFIGFLAYLSIKYQAFNIKLIATEILIISISILTVSIIFLRTIDSVRIITIFTFLLSSSLGYTLVKSVKREIKQREQIENLAVELEGANDRLKELDKLKSEFVSIASHQLRSPLTSIRGYSSLLLDGSYGPISNKAIEPLTRIEESAKLMAMSIEDYLNVSRIESGNMKYNKADFNLKDEAEHVCDGLRTEAIKKGIGLIFRSDLKSRGVVNADLGKTVQIVNNLVNNSLKYTPQGSIKVLVRDDVVRKKIFVDIMDTGIGMNEKTQRSIFQKFERAENANAVNTSGTGLGLYVAQKMAEGMGGSITAFSEGDGKGSRFTLELPLAM